MAIYEEAIPEHERKSRDTIKAMLRSPSHRIIAAFDDETAIGLCILYKGRSLALIEYLATASFVRGRGIGGQLYALARTEAGSLPLLLEVEPECVADDGADMRARRVGFYRRLGCRKLANFAFILPLHGGDFRLHLMADSDRQSVDACEVGAWVREMYVDVYHCSTDDARLAAMISLLPPVIRLE